MPHPTTPTKPRPATRPAPHEDQLDALVGMLLEAARTHHAMLGGDLREFDFDQARDRFRRIARARNSATARRYRALARRGIGAPTPPRTADGARPRRTPRLEPRPPCFTDTPPY